MDPLALHWPEPVALASTAAPPICLSYPLPLYLQVFLMVNTPETAKRVGKAQVDLALVGGELGSLNTGAAVDDDKLALNRCVALEAPWQPQLSHNWAQLSPNSFSNRSKSSKGASDGPFGQLRLGSE